MNSSSTMLRHSVSTDSDWPATLREAWLELVEDSTGATMFQTWEWQTAWWTYYRGGRTPWILEFHDGDRLVGLMPMAASKGLWRGLVPIGYGKSDYLQPLARSGYEDAVGKAVADYLRSSHGFQIVQFAGIQATEPLARHLGFSQLTSLAECYLLDLNGDFESYFAGLNDRMKRYLRRYDREYAASGVYSVEMVEHEGVEEAIEALIRLHTLRWNQRGEPGGLAFAPIRNLLKRWAELASERGWLRLHVLRHRSEPVGAILAATMHGTCYCHIIGFDPAHGAIRPGWVLYRESIRQAFRDDCRRYDFMLGAEDYKAKWGPQHCIANYDYSQLAPGLRGKLARLWHGKGRLTLIVARRRALSWWIRSRDGSGRVAGGS